MNILGIETSCDETAAAVVADGRKILAHTLSSSQDLHQKSGGIIPEIAAREQVKWMIPVIEKTLEKIGEKNFQNIDALAVTVGPGLIGSLLVGVETAKTLAFLTKKPLIPVNHLLSHLYANWLGEKIPRFPAVGLVVSGGHTEIFFLESHQKIKWLGGTRDDAAGETFDKTGRLLGLSYPGGPAIAKEAQKVRSSEPKWRLPRPMLNQNNFDFSFSGLKTAVLRQTQFLKKNHLFNSQTVSQMAFEIQEAITDVLVEKTFQAALKYQAQSLLLGGGVAANNRLREKLKAKTKKLKEKIELFLPPPELCTDNAAIVASCAFFHFSSCPWQKIQAQPDLTLAERSFFHL